MSLQLTKQLLKIHPATLALAEAVEKINGSAVVTVVSSMGNDSGALSLTLEQLKQRGFSVVFVRGPRTKKPKREYLRYTCKR